MGFFGYGAAGAGVALGAASILSVGPNNLMMIREGIVRGRAQMVASLVWASYVTMLITAFVLSDRLTIETSVKSLLAWLGFAALSWFAVGSLRAAFRAGDAQSAARLDRESWQACMGRVLRVVWLNPLTYVELLIIPAAICGTFSSIGLRLQFLIGLILMATVCCYGYALFGRLCAGLLRHRRTLQIFDLTSGLILCSVAITMAAQLLGRAP